MSIAAFEEALALWLRLGMHSRASAVLINLASLARRRHDFAGAQRWYAQCLALTRQMGNSDFLPFLLVNVAPTLLRLDRGDEARTCAVEALLRLRESPDRRPTHCLALDAMAGVLAVTGATRRAARLLGAADASLEALGARREVEDQDEYEHTVARARAALGAETFALAYAGGKLVSLDAALEEALGLTSGAYELCSMNRVARLPGP